MSQVWRMRLSAAGFSKLKLESMTTSKLFELNLGAISQSLQTIIRRKIVTTPNICMCGQGQTQKSRRGGSINSLIVYKLTLEAMTLLLLLLLLLLILVVVVEIVDLSNFIIH